MAILAFFVTNSRWLVTDYIRVIDDGLSMSSVLSVHRSVSWKSTQNSGW